MGEYRRKCLRCGAVQVDNQIGLEATPQEYISHLVLVFREVRRVLKPDGICYINIGDVYAHEQLPDGIKPKDLIGLPFMLASALRADGWYWREGNIWHKPNAPPESITDRCTLAHEHLLMFAKSANYYYDAAAIYEPTVLSPGMRFRHDQKHTNRTGQRSPVLVTKERKNKRSVWTVNKGQYDGEHLAAYPPALIEPMILAGCPRGGVVLDPFAGVGTTGLVAERLKRQSLLIELNADYLTQAYARIASNLKSDGQPETSQAAE
jgi:DNA modification methylase